MTTGEDQIAIVDPLDTLTRVQKIELSLQVLNNFNSYSQSDIRRPGSDDWEGNKVYEENSGNPIFERMAWQILNRNFYENAKLSQLEPPTLLHIMRYFYDFTTHDGSNMLTRPMPWVKQARKNITEYLLTNYQRCNSRDNEENAEAFLSLSGWVLFDGTYREIRGNIGHKAHLEEVDEWNRIDFMKLQFLHSTLN